MKREEFEALAEEIGRGADVDQEELVEAEVRRRGQ